jgi:hypothetical protein
VGVKTAATGVEAWLVNCAGDSVAGVRAAQALKDRLIKNKIQIARILLTEMFGLCIIPLGTL